MLTDTVHMRGHIQIVDLDTGSILIDQPNATTDILARRCAELVRGSDVVLPNAVGLSTEAMASGENPATKTHLNAEFQRDSITSRLIEGSATVRLAAVIDTEIAATVRQLGLFAGSRSTYILDSCDTLNNVISNATLSLDPNNKRIGTDSIKATTVNRNSVSRSLRITRDFFVTDWRDADSGEVISLDDGNLFLEFWYRVNSKALLEADPVVQLYADDDSTNPKYLEWTIPRTNLTDGEWYWVSLRFGDYTNKVGMPNAAFDGSTIDDFRFIIDPVQSALPIEENFDQIQISKYGGDLWAVSDLATPLDKQAGVALGVYWSLSFSGGSAYNYADYDSADYG